MSEQYLVIGLGNPGDRYAATRHNLGQIVLDLLAARAGSKFKKHPRAQAVTLDVRFGPLPSATAVGGATGMARAILAKSTGYMNTSGGPVAALAKYYNITPENIVVVHDDVDLPYGDVKLKLGGGEGGHNGLRDISKALGTQDYLRVRLGVGRPPGRMDTADYVLKDFNAAERKELPQFVTLGADAVDMLLTKGIHAAQQHYHSQNTR
jgi:peptidyl-tRNA hydrolase, PTH1 family